jgi:hypothetical protein
LDLAINNGSTRECVSQENVASKIHRYRGYVDASGFGQIDFKEYFKKNRDILK